jgi:hypothetical protein
MNAGRSERAAAGADGDLAALEVAEELLPFLVGRDAVFVGGPHGAAAGEERQVGLDGLVGVDSLWRRRILQLSECLFSGMFCG